MMYSYEQGKKDAKKEVAKELRRISEMNVSPIEQWIETRKLIKQLDGVKVR